MRIRIIKTSLFFILLLIISVLAVVDLKSHMVIVIANQDKYLHFITFFILFLLATYIFRPNYPYQLALVLFLFGMLLEFLQEYLSGGTRHFHRLDVCFNILGIALAWIVVSWLYPRFRHR